MAVKGVPELLRNLTRWKEQKVMAVYEASAAIQAMVVIQAQQMCPVHITNLLKSIQPGVVEIRHNSVTAEVKAEADYASYVELGTRPHFPPPEALKEWSEDKLGDESAAWAVARAISRRGTRPQPFLGPALMANQRVFVTAIARAMKT